MARRNGAPSMMTAAKILCRLIVDFTPVIQRLYPTNTSLLAALAAANAACATLHAELGEIRSYGT